MCPTDARTSNPLPRYFSIVFALAGDSTITNALLVAIPYPIPSLSSRLHRQSSDSRILLRFVQHQLVVDVASLSFKNQLIILSGVPNGGPSRRTCISIQHWTR